jgi:ribosomal protein S18 acetylase RimI-like enzyme
MAYTIRELHPEDPAEAQRAADMFNGFDSVWPGGFNRGLTYTGEYIREFAARQQRLLALVAEHEGEFVGYTDLFARTGDMSSAYINTVGASPAHLGRGVGKMLLREMVRRVAAMGYPVVTLYTWAGNLRALPLYKKTGFQWVPETDVFMKNYMPAILTLPETRAFFAGRDWYDCYERSPETVPDDVVWNGMRVYPYRFRAGDETLDLMFDHVSDGLTAIETPHLAVCCRIPVEEGVAGRSCPIVWEIETRSGRPVEAVLTAGTDPDLEISVQERLTVRDSVRIERELTISPEARPRGRREPQPQVHTTLMLDGVPIRLQTGVKVVRPVEIEFSGCGLYPGREEKTTVVLSSKLDEPIEGLLTLEDHPEIVCAEPARPFKLAARSRTRCEFALTAKSAGCHSTSLRVDSDAVKSGRPVSFRAVADRPVCSIDPDYDRRATLEGFGLSVEVNLLRGGISLHRTGVSGTQLKQDFADAGPPYPGELGGLFAPIHCSAREAGGESLVVSAPSPDRPGLIVERTVSLLGSDVVRVDYAARNESDLPIAACLRICSHLDGLGTPVYPTELGLIRSPDRTHGGFPGDELDLFDPGGRFVESWAAFEIDGSVRGLLWPADAGIDMQWSWLPNIHLDLGEIPAGETRIAPPIYAVTGPGEWKLVRDWWTKLIPRGEESKLVLDPVPVLDVKSSPSPILLTSERQTVAIDVNNRRGVSVHGALRFEAPALSIAPASLTLPAVNRKRPLQAEVTVDAPMRPLAGFMRAELDSVPCPESFRLPFVRLAGEGEMRVYEEPDGRIRVSNGLLTLRVAPDFKGSLTSLQRDGVEHLFSAFPMARPHIWWNPWHGGVCPAVNGKRLDLTREKFHGQPVERAGERGICWRGVRVACSLQHRDWRWLGLETEYLTLPGSNIVALVSRWTNGTDAAAELEDAGVEAYLQVGGSLTGGILHWICAGERKRRVPGGFGAGGSGTAPWAAVENPQSGDVLELIASDPAARVAFGTIDDAYMLEARGSVSLEPGETKEILSWLVLCRTGDDLDSYASLADVRKLP